MSFTADNISGQVFTTVEQFTFKYSELIFNSISKGFLGIFSVCFALYLMIQLFQKGILKGEIPVSWLFTPAIICTMVSLALADFQFLRGWIFDPVYNMSTNLTVQAVTLGVKDYAIHNIVDMLNVIERQLDQSVFAMCRTMLAQVGLTSYIQTLFAGLIIQGVFVFVWFLFLALMIDSLFKYMAVFATSPLLVISLAFPTTKTIGITGLKILLNALLTMFFAGIAMGFTILVMKVSGLGPLDNNGNIKTDDWAFSRSYWAFFLVGLVSVYFHLKVPKLAANFSAIDDGAGVAAAVAGLGTMAVMGAKSMASNVLGKAGSFAFQKASQYTKEGAARVWDKLRGY
jgi:hypothetical protein